MPCPNYDEKNQKCRYEGPLELTPEKIKEDCSKTEPWGCSNYRSSRRDLKRQEEILTALDGRRGLTRDQLAGDIPDAEIDSCYHRGPGGTFIPK